MREIGGYIELDTYNLSMLHEGAIALNCGRNALAYLLKARKIQKIWIPKFICDSVIGVCQREDVPYELYGVGQDFLLSGEINLGDGEWLYLVNYYSQLTNDQILAYVSKYKRVIVDNAQSYFQSPVSDVDTLYTCRKYFGVADGAFLYTNAMLHEDFPLDESHERMGFLLGRYERPANEFYKDYNANNKLFINEPIKRMSRLTNNLLHGINYLEIEKRRKENFEYLHEKLGRWNLLTLRETGTFMYPFMIESGAKPRKTLQRQKIYIPTLWPSVFSMAKPTDMEYKMAETILPLPIDQRYRIDDMVYMVQEVRKCLNSER